MEIILDKILTNTYKFTDLKIFITRRAEKNTVLMDVEYGDMINLMQ